MSSYPSLVHRPVVPTVDFLTYSWLVFIPDIFIDISRFPSHIPVNFHPRNIYISQILSSSYRTHPGYRVNYTIIDFLIGPISFYSNFYSTALTSTYPKSIPDSLTNDQPFSVYKLISLFPYTLNGPGPMILKYGQMVKLSSTLTIRDTSRKMAKTTRWTSGK